MGLLDMGATVLSGGANIIGGNAATNIQRRGIRRASDIADKGYQQAEGYQKPIYDRAMGDYTNLSEKYRSGGFGMPEQTAYKPGSFDYNPNDVASDPEYKAQLESGTRAIEGGAASKGMLFSGKTGKDLTKFGSDLFANRSDELFKRARDTYEDDRDFGYGADNEAYDRNNQIGQQDFSRGLALTSGLSGAAGNLSDLANQRAGSRANAELGVANARARNYRNAFGQAGQSLEGMLGGIDPEALMAGGLY